GRNEATLQIERATAAAQSAEKERTELQAQVSELHVRKSALRDKTQALSESAAKARTALEELQEQATRLAIERERVESELARIDEQLEARGFSDGEESATFNVDDEQAMRSEARTLKKRINELGVINPGSIEEYREARERYELLTAQRDDLEEAKADLTEVIARIDRESVKKLQSVYDELKTAFSDMFRRLFGGGQASLAFTDPD